MILQDQSKLLSYLGLFPFVLMTAMLWINPTWAEIIFEIFIIYSTLIFVFLTGTWWGFAQENNKTLLPSIFFFFLPFLIILIIMLFSNQFRDIFSMPYEMAAILLGLLISYESGHIYEKNFLNLDKDYLEMRFYLTFGVRICHLLMIAFIFTYT